MTRELRDYQREAVDAIYDEWKDGNTRTAIVLPTGAGKTDVIAAVATDGAREPGGRVLVLAHRSELLDQITERCLMHDPAIPVGRVQASTFNGRRPITVAMAPTLARPKRQAQMLRPTRVIVDECHHAPSKSYMDILRWAGCFDEVDPTPLMGVTATFVRGDKLGLGDAFQSVAYQRDTAWAIGQGWLVRPHGRVVVGSHMDLDHAKVSRGDFQDNELGEMVAQDVEQIVAAWTEHAADRLTAAFTPNVASASALAEAFRAAGVPVGEVYGSTPHPERRRIYAALGRGEIRVLVNVMVATEGFDCPAISCVLNCRPTKLPGLYTQMVGRGLRLSPETGKTDCLVLDVVGASRTQRLVTLVELHPSAVYDDTELDLAPCETCGGYTTRRPAAVKAAAERGMDACGCPCEDCGAPRDEQGRCECEPVGRDPDGGRRRLIGPARYEDIDLLAVAVGSDLNWLTTPGGITFVAAGKFLAAVIPSGRRGGEQLYSAGFCEAWGHKPGTDLVVDVPLEQARAAVEAWAEAEGAHLRSAPWRNARARATEQAQQLAARLGIENPQNYTKGGLSDAIDVVRAARRFDRAVARAAS